MRSSTISLFQAGLQQAHAASRPHCPALITLLMVGKGQEQEDQQSRGHGAAVRPADRL